MPSQASLDFSAPAEFPDTPVSRAEQLPVTGATLTLHRHYLPSTRSQALFDTLRDTVPWQQDTLIIAGRRIPVPRLQAWYGDEEATYAYSGLRLTPLPWSAPLQALREALSEHCGFPFNSVLANYYRDGMDSVAWHADDEPELGPSPLIASLSLGATRTFQLKPKAGVSSHLSRRLLRCSLDDGSLLVMGSGLQSQWLHRLPKEPGVENARINLTFRQVLPR